MKKIFLIFLIIPLHIFSQDMQQNAIRFPNERVVYPSVGNPLFITDVQNATQSVNEGLRALLGLPASGSDAFAIIYGLNYTYGSPGHYSSGYVYFNDTIYYFSTYYSGHLHEGEYLKPNTTLSYNKTFSDGNVRPTYKIYSAIQSATPYGSFPVFSGNMNQYRLNLKTLNDKCFALEGIYTINKSAWGGSDTTVIAPSYVTYHQISISGSDKTFNYYLLAETKIAFFQLHINPPSNYLDSNVIKIYTGYGGSPTLRTTTTVSFGNPALYKYYMIIRSEDETNAFYYVIPCYNQILE